MTLPLPEPHECEITQADLDDLRTEMDDKIEGLSREIDELRTQLSDLEA